ncbi:DNA-binding transcriptional LysR family regulator [Bacillus pakistanensis]|uniref:DNA-binding transcriptional LysR family regulator n=1 Tax=Rossellomorea pakistanensis TaxID=992288 RepID=A0ABS2NCC6_9BACI|nr:LysR family transcriptional regulator [Bacillus pakistanensis]MBM7585513.1 DNA-binding transcriptional LysR family regulator [Bacillus pakistanensis]
MDIRHLKYFIEVSRFNSFTRAADHLFVTQPTISKMIKNLESELGVELFDRSRKKLVLTDAGRVILKQAQTIDNAFNNLQTELDDLLGLQKGHIRIGVPSIMDVDHFIRILGEFHQLYPHITFQLSENGTKKIEEDIINDYLDVGITVLPTKEEEFHYFSFMKEELRVVVPPTHPLASRKQIKLEELKEEQFILFNKDFALNDLITGVCKKAGFLPQVISESSQWDFIGKMIKAGLGISILPYSVSMLLKEDLHKIKVVKPRIEWDLAIIWRKNHYLSYATKEWLKFTQDRLMMDSTSE